MLKVNKVTTPILVWIAAVIGIILVVYAVYLNLFTNFYLNAFLIYNLCASAIVFISMIGYIKMKRIAVYSYIAIFFLGRLIDIVSGTWTMGALDWLIVGFIIFVGLYYRKQMS